MNTNREFSEERYNCILGPPSVPASRGPSSSSSRRLLGGPPCKTPRRLSSRYSTKLPQMQAGGTAFATPSVKTAPLSVCKQNTTKDSPSVTSASVLGTFEVLGTASALDDDCSSISFNVEEGVTKEDASPPTVCVDDVCGGPSEQQDQASRSALMHSAGGMKASVSYSVSDRRVPAVEHVYHSDDDNDPESLPLAAPPPLPYPAVRQKTEMLHRSKGGMRLNKNGTPRGGYHLIERETNALGVPGEEEGQKMRVCTEPHVAATPTLSTAVPPSVRTYLDEVCTWINLIEVVKKVNDHRWHVDGLEKALSDVQQNIEALELEHDSADAGLRAAKALSLNRSKVRGSDALQRARRGHTTNANGEVDQVDDRECEFSDELEAWRVEKGELIAQKALLLQKRNELQYHLRRGTNIKSVSSVTQAFFTSRSQDDDNSTTPATSTNDVETIQMRLELKEIQVGFMKLLNSHRALKEARQANQAEFEKTCATLRRDVAAAKQSADTWKCSLQAFIREAEQQKNIHQKCGDASLALLLEHNVDESKRVLKHYESAENPRNSARLRMSSVTRSLSLPSM